MAGETDNGEDQASGSHEPRECMPCRGSGQVISNLGGSPSKVACPWCGGSGMRVAGTDAQARWPTEQVVADAEGAAEPVPPDQAA